jgi:hypothetical protein
MRTLAILASVVTLAAGSTGCSSANAANEVGPSTVATAPSTAGTTGVFVANAAGGQGKGKGNTPSSGSGTLSTLDYVMVTDNNTNGVADRGDTISFAIGTTQQWNQVTLTCSQNGDVVLSAVRTNFAWYPITLEYIAWQAGTVDCLATLDQFAGAKIVTLASTNFQASAD